MPAYQGISFWATCADKDVTINLAKWARMNIMLGEDHSRAVVYSDAVGPQDWAKA